jgi:hypothetical protein
MAHTDPAISDATAERTSISQLCLRPFSGLGINERPASRA